MPQENITPEDLQASAKFLSQISNQSHSFTHNTALREKSILEIHKSVEENKHFTIDPAVKWVVAGAAVADVGLFIHGAIKGWERGKVDNAPETMLQDTQHNGNVALPEKERQMPIN